MKIGGKVLYAISLSALVLSPAYGGLVENAATAELHCSQRPLARLNSEPILLADDYDPHKSIFDTYASKARSRSSTESSILPSSTSMPVSTSASPAANATSSSPSLKSLMPMISEPAKTNSNIQSVPAHYPLLAAPPSVSSSNQAQFQAQSPVKTGGYNPAENQIVLPVKPKAQVISQNPEGSLNFAGAPHSHGPFNDATAISMNRQNNYEGLLDYARAWTAEQPKNGFAWFCLGQSAMKLGNYDAAVEGYRRASMYTAQEPKVWNNLSAAYCKRQQWGLAIKAIHDGEAASGSHCSARDWYVFGNALKDLKEYENAINAYNKALSMNPNFPEANNNRGICYEMVGNNSAASQSYNTAARQGNSFGSNNQANLEASQRAQAQQAYDAMHPGGMELWRFNKMINDARRNGTMRNQN